MEGWRWLANGSLQRGLLDNEVSRHVCNYGSLTIDVARKLRTMMKPTIRAQLLYDLGVQSLFCTDSEMGSLLLLDDFVLLP